MCKIAITLLFHTAESIIQLKKWHLQYKAKRLAGKNVLEMTYSVFERNVKR